MLDYYIKISLYPAFLSIYKQTQSKTKAKKARTNKDCMHSSWIFFSFPLIVLNVLEGQPFVAMKSAHHPLPFPPALVIFHPALILSLCPPCPPPRGECSGFSYDVKRLAVEKLDRHLQAPTNLQLPPFALSHSAP